MALKRIVFVLLILSTLSCNKKNAPPEGLQVHNTIVSGGIPRTYHLYIPNEGSNQALVILLHGGGGNNDDLIGLGNVKAPYKVWLSLAKQNNFMVAAPNATFGSTDERMWNDCRSDAEGNAMSDDVGFIEDMLDEIESNYDYNENKTYVMGTSNGGHMSIRLAEEIPDRITAFTAVVAANSANSQCTQSSVPVSAMFMNGTQDPILPYNGGEMISNRGLVYSADESVDYWVNKNGTSTTPIIENISNNNPDDGCHAVKYTYQNGTNGTEVVLYQIVDGGHAEPSIQERYRNFYLAVVGNQNGDFEMANAVWDFFKTKSK